jgi:hypothetical protein
VNWGRPDRIRAWVECNVHVQGRPEWVFVKLHTHGAIERDFDALFGEKAFASHRVLNEEWNDGADRQLHYATAREAYNMVRAAEAGHGGDPSSFRDFEVKPYATSVYRLDARHRLLECTQEALRIASIEEKEGPVTLLLAAGLLKELRGRLRSVALSTGRVTVGLAAEGSLDLVMEEQLLAVPAGGAELRGETVTGRGSRFTFKAGEVASFEFRRREDGA